ncbi:MAG: hypothetical protein HYW96_00110 [Candidatus Wildermuthbacteria bacterium]|nr:hypothetical protein [Candidatus Wildermuthbacteria bacterium]
MRLFVFLFVFIFVGGAFLVSPQIGVAVTIGGACSSNADCTTAGEECRALKCTRVACSVSGDCAGNIGGAVGWAGAECFDNGTTKRCIETPGGKGLPSDTAVPGTGLALLQRIDLITNWVFAVFIAISVIFIVLAAFQFVTGGGKPEEVSAARQKLIYAVIGIAIALLARALPLVLRNILI